MTMTVNQVGTAPVKTLTSKPSFGNTQNQPTSAEKTAQLCAYTALGTSIATLIPLSILAIKTGKISKVAEDFAQGVQPILNNAGAITSNINRATGAVSDAISKGAEETISAVTDSKKLLSNALETITNKIKEADTKETVKLVNELAETLKSKVGVTLDNVNTKIAEADTKEIVKTVHEIVETLKTKIDGTDLADVTNKLAAAIEDVSKNMPKKELKATFANIKKTVPDATKITNNVVSTADGSAKAMVKDVEEVANKVATTAEKTVVEPTA